jgi:hypothetical protein
MEARRALVILGEATGPPKSKLAEEVKASSGMGASWAGGLFQNCTEKFN